MADKTRAVVKIGGSLFRLPELANRLTDWLSVQAEADLVLVPGGGPLADVIRGWQPKHQLSEATCHQLALSTMTVSAKLIEALLPDHPGWTVLEPLPFFRDDPGLEASWRVTSDSLALRAAQRLRATRLVLLKSVPWPGFKDWTKAAQAGLVDSFFPDLLAHQPVPIAWVNFADRDPDLGAFSTTQLD